MRLGLSPLLILEQEGSEVAAHVPFDVVVSKNSIGQ